MTKRDNYVRLKGVQTKGESIISNITISNLSFAYGAETIFDNLSLQISTDWKLGLCGRNGRGKTTFLRLLCGELEHDGHIAADVSFERFPTDGATTPAALFCTLAPDAEDWQIAKECALLQLNEDMLARPFGTLSGGERVRVMLAGLFLRAMHRDTFLLIDEPTDHLDAQGRALVVRYLNKKDSFILVSHDRAFLDACTDHTLALNKETVELVHGNFSVWWEEKQRRDAFEVAQSGKLAKEISRLQKSAAQSANWADKTEASKHQKPKSGNSIDTGFVGHKAAKMMKRAKSAEKRVQSNIAEKQTLLRNVEREETLKLSPLVYHSARLLSMDNAQLTIDNQNVGGRLTFEVLRGERIALQGGNGTGKTTLLRYITAHQNGKRDPSAPHCQLSSGTLTVGGGLTVSVVPQDASGLRGGLRDFARESKIDETCFFTILRKMGFERQQFETDTVDMSAGQQKKVLLARSLCTKAHLYLWDEPLNYIDVFSRMQIESLILEAQPTLIFVEHDRVFCENIATKTLRL